MAPKRSRNADDEVMTYFIDQINQWTPKNAAMRSFHELVLDAHEWGEARVRAELLAMQLQGVSAVQRRHRLRAGGQSWYTAGYRMYLVPESADLPDALMDDCLRTNSKLNEQAESARRNLAVSAGKLWWDKYASTICNEASVQADTETCRNTATTTTTTTATAPSHAYTSPATALASSPAARPRPPAPTQPPAPPRPRCPTLPKELRHVLEHPTEKRASKPRKGIEATVAAAFDAQRMMRAWDDPDASTKNGIAFKLLQQHAYATQAQLNAQALQAVYGRGRKELSDTALQTIGLRKFASGGYNSIWVATRSEVPCINKIFPECGIADLFLEGKLALRVPHSCAPWLSFDEAVGEATNMLFTALCGFGPKVALLSYARKVFKDETSKEEGMVAVKYKLFAFLELATESVEKRYAPEILPSISATASGSYYQALLVCIYRVSWQGFVHLDGTLRNFVDFYPRTLPGIVADWRVNVIDVEQKAFRRLCPEASTEWRDLFLMNLLVVLCFLKIRLGSRWNPEIHWMRVRSAVQHLITDLRGRHTLPAIAYWEGNFVLDEAFPNMLFGKYAGKTHEAAMHVLTRQMHFYLLQQPMDQCTNLYTTVLHSGALANTAALVRAKSWYDNVYRTDMYPPQRYFRDKLVSDRRRTEPRLFVVVLFEFLEMPYGELVVCYGNRLPPSSQHRVDDTREALLGV